MARVVGEAIKARRSAAGLSPEELAQRASIPARAVSAGEEGRAVLTLDALVAVAGVLGASAAELVAALPSVDYPHKPLEAGSTWRPELRDPVPVSTDVRRAFGFGAPLRPPSQSTPQPGRPRRRDDLRRGRPHRARPGESGPRNTRSPGRRVRGAAGSDPRAGGPLKPVLRDGEDREAHACSGRTRQAVEGTPPRPGAQPDGARRPGRVALHLCVRGRARRAQPESRQHSPPGGGTGAGSRSAGRWPA